MFLSSNIKATPNAKPILYMLCNTKVVLFLMNNVVSLSCLFCKPQPPNPIRTTKFPLQKMRPFLHPLSKFEMAPQRCPAFFIIILLDLLTSP